MRDAIRDTALAQLLEGAHAARGIDLRGYRRGTVEERVAKHLETLGCPNLADYMERLREDPREYDRLIDCGPP